MMLLIAAALAYPALGAETNRVLARAPREIGVFLERRAECEHWGGEEPYDKDRLAEINRAVKALRCDRIPADERILRRKYARRPAVLRLLKLD
jgi:hypothetical protein